MAAQDKMKNILKFIKEDAPLGYIVEIGVYRGGSFYQLVNADPDRICIGYDTFCGLPEHTEFDNHHVTGDFANTSLAEVSDYMVVNSPNEKWVLVRGRYPESDWFRPSPIALAHVDVDTYTSTRDCLNHLLPLMAPGGRIYIDDAYVKSCEGATKAVEEFRDRMHVPLIVVPTISGIKRQAYMQF
jgi:O-methyltransferase